VLVSSKSRSLLHVGDQVGSSIANGKALLFDKANERRIVPLG
jgi:multiple sugar transport system ATP-binding protein